MSLGVIPSPLHLPISSVVLEPLGLASWFSWKSYGGSELSEKIKEMRRQDRKEPKLYHNRSNSEPIILSSALTSPSPQLHFLLFPVHWMVLLSATGWSHKHGGHLGLTHSSKFCQGHCFFSSPRPSPSPTFMPHPSPFFRPLLSSGLTIGSQVAFSLSFLLSILQTARMIFPKKNEIGSLLSLKPLRNHLC